MKMKKMFSIIAALMMLFAATNTFAANTGASPAAPEDYIGYKVDVPSGKYNMTLNLRNNTLGMEPAQDVLFLGGPAVTSDGTWAEEFKPTTKDNSKRVFRYSGRINNGELKFYDGESFSNTTQYTSKYENITPARGSKYVIVSNDSHDYKFNMQSGYYNIEIDVEDMVMTVNDKMYLIGDAVNSWAWTTAVEMTYDKGTDKYIYTGQLKAGEFKFCPWYDDFTTGAIVAGGSVVNVTTGVYNTEMQHDAIEKNFNITEAGEYTLTLDPSNNKLTVQKNTVTNDHIYMIGNAVGSNGWGNDHAANGAKLLRQTDGSYSFKGYLFDNDFKFTINESGFGDGDWVAEWGDEGNNQIINNTGNFNIIPWVEGKDRKFKLNKAGYYEMSVNPNTGKLYVTKYIGEIFYVYGEPTGSGNTVVNDHGTMITETYTVNGHDALRHVWRGHLAPGKLKIAKYTPGAATNEYVYFGATTDITEYPTADEGRAAANIPVTSDQSPLNTSAAGVTNIVRSYYEMGTFGSEDATGRYNFDVKGGYYEIALEQYNEQFIVRFNKVRDVLRMIGEAVGGWDFDNYAVPMQPTTEGFVYKSGFACPETDGTKKAKFEGYQGYLMGLELKFCEQFPTAEDKFGAFYTHAWGPKEKDDVPVKDCGTFAMSELNEDDMMLDYKFDMYPGDYDILVNLTEGHETMTVRSFNPHQKVVVGNAGMATFMTPYHTASNTTVDDAPADFSIYKAQSIIKKNDGGRDIKFVKQDHFEASTPYVIKAPTGRYNITPEGGISGIAMKVNAEQQDKPAKYGYDFEKNFVHNDCNLLVGNWHMSVKRQNSVSKKFYLLQKRSEELGGLAFYYMPANTDYSLAPYSCYLDISGVSEEDYEPEAAPAKVMKMVFVDNDFEEEDDIVTGIESATDNACINEIYSIDGIKTNAMQKGINIVRMADGSVRKIMIK